MLGSMGQIQKVFVAGKPVFLCCPICIKGATDNPTGTLARLQQLQKGANTPMTEEERKMRQRYEQLSLEDRKLVDEQRLCPITDEPLLSMAVPIKLMVKGRPVLICCKGCKSDVEKKPDQAWAVYKMAAQRDPNNWLTHAGLARIACAQGNYTEATKQMQAALEGAPDPAKSGVQGLITKLQNKQDINQ